MSPTERSVESLARRLGRALLVKGYRVTTAESCTGGWVAKAITEVPGSSHWFDGGFVTYSNAAKTSLLSVPRELIDAHGAVSEPVACAMAEGARERLGADLAVAVSGIAGPDGGTDEKPVGTVYFAWAALTGTRAECRVYSGDREAIRRQSVEHALEGLLAQLWPGDGGE